MEGESRHHAIVSLLYRNIQYYREMLVRSKDSNERRYYRNLIYNETMRLNYWRMYHLRQPKEEEDYIRESSAINEREITRDELSQYNGSGGKPAYVAVNKVVYDVSSEATWGGGTHFSLYAGKDLTDVFNGCHGGRLEVLRNLPKVGVLID